jgi:hypothetical protein
MARGARVSEHSTKSVRLARRSLAVIVCYALVVQAFAIGLVATQALAKAGPAVDAIIAMICHGAGSAGPDGAPVGAGCTHCAVAACGALLATPAPAIDLPPTVATRLGPCDTDRISASQPARAGMARAPPTFA